MSMFQSAPPVKAATGGMVGEHLPESVSIRAAREGGDVPEGGMEAGVIVSIRAAREGGDFTSGPTTLETTCFNPRRP